MRWCKNNSWWAAALVVGCAVITVRACGSQRPAGADDVVMTGSAVAGLEPYDDLFTSFLAKHKIPGASVCISRDGKVVYARGFGFADVDAKKPVEPNALFRIASVSKPITSVAILQLVEQGKLSLDDNPFVLLGYSDQLEDPANDPRLRQITVRQVLQHAAGWDRGASYDPMFQYERIATAMNVPLPPTQRAIIEFMLTQPLDFDPGTKYAYSNFGYCVLGRVIEKISGQTYENYVQESVLAPVGVTDMQIGRSLPEQRAEHEVVYYDARERTATPLRDLSSTVPMPYVIDHETMDSHGAWIASAIDLVKFADAFNDRTNSVLLEEASIETMFAPPDGAIGHKENGKVKTVYYACGWSVRPQKNSINTWHNGLINGTSTLLVRRHDGMNWAVLFNTDSTSQRGKPPASLIDPLMHRTARKIKEWPS